VKHTDRKLFTPRNKVGSWNSSIGIVTRLRSGLLDLAPTQNPSHGYLDFFQGVKRPDREVYHSAPTSAEVKNKCSYMSAPLILMYSGDRENFMNYIVTSLVLFPRNSVYSCAHFLHYFISNIM